MRPLKRSAVQDLDTNMQSPNQRQINFISKSQYESNSGKMEAKGKDISRQDWSCWLAHAFFR
jgi:hypothetical protein